jgi:indole-3-glycerol phosphate synthase
MRRRFNFGVMSLAINPTVLDEIVARSKRMVADDKSRVPIAELEKRIADRPAPISFFKSISGEFGLIAEIKRRSPSQGAMRHQDIERIARIYQNHDFVRAISMLTNRDDFKMSIQDLATVRKLTDKPILRKDFIFDEYQIFEARAYGADAVLLMANVLKTTERMRELFELSRSLGMDVLFECRNKSEIDAVPEDAKIYGINSRKLNAKKVLWFSRYTLALIFRGILADQSVQLGRFALATAIPKKALKVAESGLTPREIGRIRSQYDYNAALVGTAILNAATSVESALNTFWRASQIEYHTDPVPGSGGRHVPT